MTEAAGGTKPKRWPWPVTFARPLTTGYRPATSSCCSGPRRGMWLFEAALKQAGLRPYVVGARVSGRRAKALTCGRCWRPFANPLDDEALAGALAGQPADSARVHSGCSAAVAIAISRSGRWSRTWRISRIGDLRGRQPAGRRVRGDHPAPSRGAGGPAAFSRGQTAVSENRLRPRQSDAGSRLVPDWPTSGGWPRSPASSEATEGRDLRGLIEWIDDSARLDSEQAVATEDERVGRGSPDDDPQVEGSLVPDGLRRRPRSGLEPIRKCDLDLATERRSGQVRSDCDCPNRGPGLDLFRLQQTLKDQARTDKTDEELRILHVAMTRAESRLVLGGVADFEEDPLTRPEANPLRPA